jgi:hypothetical protein
MMIGLQETEFPGMSQKLIPHGPPAPVANEQEVVRGPMTHDEVIGIERVVRDAPELADYSRPEKLCVRHGRDPTLGENSAG